MGHAAHLAAHATRSRELAALVTDATSKGEPPAVILEKVVADMLPEWAPTAACLAEPLDVEGITVSPLPPEITWVRNSTRHGTRGIFPIALTPLEGTRLCDMKSRCGWKFGHIPTVVAGCGPPLPREFFFVCKRCGRPPPAWLSLKSWRLY